MTTSIAKSSLSLTASAIIFMFSAYIINIILGRYLGPASYGIYGVVISLMSALNIIQTSGIPQAVSKFIAEDTNQSENILKAGLIIQSISTFVISLLFFLFANPISNILNDKELVKYLQVSSLIFPFYGLYSLYVGYYNGLHNFEKQTKISIIYSIAKSICVVTLGLTYSLTGAIIGFVFAPIIALFSAVKIPKKSERSFPYKKLIIYSLPLIGFALVSSLITSIDLYFVKALVNSENAAGYYTANQNISRIPFFALSSFALILFPLVSKNIKDEKYLRDLLQKSLRIVLIILIPLVVFMASSSKELIQLVYSDKYLPAYPSLSVLLFGSGFFTLFTILSNILNGAGMPTKSLNISIMSLLTIIIFCYILIPIYGILGAAMSTTIGSIISFIISSYFVYKKFKLRIQLLSFIKILFSSIIISLLYYFIEIPNLLLPIIYIISFIIYITLLVLLKEIKKDDFALMNSFIPNRFVNKK